MSATDPTPEARRPEPPEGWGRPGEPLWDVQPTEPGRAVALLREWVGPCRMWCQFCPWGQVPERPPLTTDPAVQARVADDLIAALAPHPPLDAVSLVSGDILDYPGILDLIDRLADEGMEVILGTPGLALADETLVEALAARPVTLDLTWLSRDPETYRAMTRNPDAAAWIEQGLHHLVAHGVPFTLATVVTSHNVDELDGLVRHAVRSFGVERMNLRVFYPDTPHGTTKYFHQFPDPDALRAAMARLDADPPEPNPVLLLGNLPHCQIDPDAYPHLRIVQPLHHDHQNTFATEGDPVCADCDAAAVCVRRHPEWSARHDLGPVDPEQVARTVARAERGFAVVEDTGPVAPAPDPAPTGPPADAVLPEEGIPPELGVPPSQGLLPGEGIPRGEGILPGEGLLPGEAPPPPAAPDGIPPEQGIPPELGVPPGEGIPREEGRPPRARRAEPPPNQRVPRGEGILPGEGLLPGEGRLPQARRPRPRPRSPEGPRRHPLLSLRAADPRRPIRGVAFADGGRLAVGIHGGPSPGWVSWDLTAPRPASAWRDRLHRLGLARAEGVPAVQARGLGPGPLVVLPGTAQALGPAPGPRPGLVRHDLRTGRVRDHGPTPSPRIRALAVQGDRLLVGGEGLVVHHREGRFLRRLLPVSERVTDLQPLGDGTVLVLGPDHAPRRIDPDDGTVHPLPHPADAPPPRSARISSDGAWLATLQADRVILWDLPRRRIRWRRRSGEHLRHLALTADERHLVCIGGARPAPDRSTTGQTLRLWNLDAGMRRADLIAHTAPVSALALAPGSRRLLTGDVDGAVSLWDLTDEISGAARPG